jgi:hypothetical protein
MEGAAGMRRAPARRVPAAAAARRSALAAIALLLLLGACGKVGPVRAPGPPDQVSHPRIYPNR